VSHVGLVLTGGGARAAYQVGVLGALAEILPPGPSPFGVVSGVSAGAINGMAFSTGAEDLQRAAARLAATWAGLTPDRIFRTGALRLARIGTRWLRDLSAGSILGRSGINYLLDSSPLRQLIEKEIPIGRMRRHIRAGRLRGVAVSATDYRAGTGVTFFEGAADIAPWARSTRVGVRSRITVEHVMASAAIPIFFPPVSIGGVFYGDGCIRMHHPMSPAIHLGADRIVAVSQRQLNGPRNPGAAGPQGKQNGLPLSEIAGVMLNAIFLDSLDSDLERLERVNRTLALVPPSHLENGDVDVRAVPALVLRPSEDLGRLAAGGHERFPAMLRYLLKGIGAASRGGEDLLSYLSFEPVYVKRVVELGHADTLARRDEIAEFLLGEGARRERTRTRA